MELMECSLYDYLNQDRSFFTECQAAFLFEKITNGVLYCHSKGIIHHDLKLENILLNLHSEGTIKSVKLADFGFSRRVSEVLIAGPDSKGTPEYMAPELLIKNTHFNQKIDSWSLGIILHEILFNISLFESDIQKKVLKKIKKFEELDFTKLLYQSVSIEAQDLLDQLLGRKQNLRLCISEILNHSWL